ncbi:Nif3-like dinuclear metal center hexameric protein [Buchnera aphidicola]|uniref:Nif3-like dinuclear metal center hexameric protein n=1 Tax=Buchnera aphidicola TaxID=9 RepID=UPI0034640053
MKNTFLENIVNTKLNSSSFTDYTYNGLQIEGCKTINNIITGVTACQNLLDQAIFYKAHAIIVHHGYFWKNDPSYIKGYIRKRLKTILINNINLYSWHLPLDAHKTLGNNVYIEKSLKIIRKGYINPYLWWGIFRKSIDGRKLFEIISKNFQRQPIYIPGKKNEKISKVAWCSGKGQKFIHEIIRLKINCFITGEISEETTHYARESNIHFFAAGHHATEKGGVKLLGQWLKKIDKKLNIQFIDIHNPV